MGLSTVEAFKHIQSKDAINLTEDQLHDLQKTLNQVLDDIASVCNKHGIQYELGGGSCLGAVRHHAFIPWDDDIDLNMPRADHDRFVKIFKEELGDKYWVHTPKETDNYGLLLSRVLLKGTSVRTREDFWNEECGAFVDIFPIENTFDNAFLRKIHGIGCMVLGFTQSCRKFYRDRKQLMSMINAGTDHDVQKYKAVFRTKICMGFLLSWMSLDSWIRLADKWYSVCHNSQSEYVSVPSGRGHFFGELYKREDICETIEMSYEHGNKKIPKNYELYLHRMYGDYMSIPKITDREQHIFFAPFYLSKEGQK